MTSSPESPAKEQPGEVAAMVKLLRGRAKVLSDIGHEEAMNDAIIMAQAAAMIKKLGQGWIPISELPPTEPRSIVIRMPQERLADDCPAHPYAISNPDYVRSGNAAKFGYTHWMPLPPPPERP